jgi:hypothetical protein
MDRRVEELKHRRNENRTGGDGRGATRPPCIRSSGRVRDHGSVAPVLEGADRRAIHLVRRNRRVQRRDRPDTGQCAGSLPQLF